MNGMAFKPSSCYKGNFYQSHVGFDSQAHKMFYLKKQSKWGYTQKDEGELNTHTNKHLFNATYSDTKNTKACFFVVLLPVVVVRTSVILASAPSVLIAVSSSSVNLYFTFLCRHFFLAMPIVDIPQPETIPNRGSISYMNKGA